MTVGANAPDVAFNFGAPLRGPRATPGHKIYAYLLRRVAIAEPNHVWASHITYFATYFGPIGSSVPPMMALPYSFARSTSPASRRSTTGWTRPLRRIAAFISAT